MASAAPDTHQRDVTGRLRLAVVAVLLVGAFAPSLLKLGRFALDHDLYSYVFLVPLVSLYFTYLTPRPRATAVASGRGVGIVLLALAGAILAGYWMASGSGWVFAVQDSLAITTLAFVMVVVGACSLLLSRAHLRLLVFPLCFLAFMVPLPVAVEAGLENFLQHGSAPPTAWLFSLAGTPYFKQDMVFQLPGMTLQIAPECSGIRSTLVLFMSSILAGYLFLRSPWRRVMLVAFVIPLALVRNGFRVFTIGELCVHIGPHMIDSDIHHKGGAIFFALSLIPFFGVLYYLVRLERPQKRAAP